MKELKASTLQQIKVTFGNSLASSTHKTLLICFFIFSVVFAGQAKALDAPGSLVPPGLNVGDEFYAVFTTSSGAALNDNLSFYNNFVNSVADGVGIGPASATRPVTWSALINATSGIQSTGLFSADPTKPIYNLGGGVNGEKVADNSADFFDGTLDNPMRYDENGVSSCPTSSGVSFTWTGMNSDGTALSPVNSSSNAATIGNCGFANSQWAVGGSSSIGSRRIYAVSPLLTVAAPDSDADLTAGITVTEPVDLPTTVTTAGGALPILDFAISDGGTSDGLPTRVTSITLNVTGTTSVAVRGQLLFRMSGPDFPNVFGSYSAGTNTVTFNSLPISVADGTTETYRVLASYNSSTSITDGDTVILTVDGDTDFTTPMDGTSTQFGTTSAVDNGTGTRTAVEASELAFSIQPAGSVSGSNLTTQPVVTAEDAFGNTDTDFSEVITLVESSAGTLTGTTQSASSGVATFTMVNYTATADQQSFFLIANDQDGVDTDLMSVDSSTVTSDVVATKLVFDTQPAPLTVVSGQSRSFSTVPVVSARNADDVVDTGYSTGITLSEVNGAGSLSSITATGDTDGSAAQVSITPSSGVATFTDLALTYINSGGGSETFNLRSTSAALTNADSSVLTSIVVDSDADLIAAGGVSEPVALNTLVDSVGEAVNIFDFAISDGGTSDGAGTSISQVVLNVSGTATDANRAKVTYRLNGSGSSNVVGVYSAGADTITFSALNIVVADGATETYTVNAYYNDNSNIVDGQTIIVSVDGDTDVTVSPTGTQFGMTTPVTNSSGTLTEVVASEIVFDTQPAGSVSGIALSTQPVVRAQDAFNNTDTDFTETVSLSEGSAGSLSNGSVAAVGGVATFTNLIYTASTDNEAFTITANDEDGTASDLATVVANAVTSDVVATRLSYDTQPVPLTVISGQQRTFTTVPVLSAVDADGTTDEDFVSDITLAEENGDGAATLSSTNDNDFSPAIVTVTAVSGQSSFDGLTATYTNNSPGSETFNLRATAFGLIAADSSVITSTALDADADIVAADNMLGGDVIEPVALVTEEADVMADAVDIFDFTIVDGGTADSTSTLVSQIILRVSGTSTDANRAKVTFRLNGNDASNVVGAYSAIDDTIMFTGLSIEVADGDTETYTVNAFYNDTSDITDNETLILSVDGDTDIITGTESTSFGTTEPVINGTGTTTAVVASELVFVTEPAGSVSGTALTTQPVVEATDRFDNLDVDFVEIVTLTDDEDGSLSNNTVAAVAGLATFTDVTYTASADQESFIITANDDDGADTDLTEVDAPAIISDVVATKLMFSAQPAPDSIESTVQVSFSTGPEVSAVDANDTVDVDFTGLVTLNQANGSGSSVFVLAGDSDAIPSTASVSASSGIADFSGLAITYTGSATVFSEDINLAVASGVLTVGSSDAIAVQNDSDDDGLSNTSEVALGTNIRNADSDGDGVSDSREVNQDKTNPLDSGSAIERLGNEVCAEWNGFISDLTQILEFRNASSTTIGVEISLKDIEGNVVSTVSRGLEPGIQVDIIANELVGFVPDSYGLVCGKITTGPENALVGQLTIYRFTDTSYTLAYSSDFQAAKTGKQHLGYNTFQPSQNPDDAGNSTFNWLQLVNAGDTPAAGFLRLFDADGLEVSSQEIGLEGNARVDIDIHSLGINRIGLAEWEPNEDDTRFFLKLNRYFIGATPDQLIDVASITAKRGTGSEIVAGFDTRDGFTSLEMHNVSDSAITVEVDIFDASGNATATQPAMTTIAAQGTVHLVLDQHLPEGIGSVRATSSNNESLLTDLITYRVNENGSFRYVNPKRLEEFAGTADLKGTYNSFLGQNCVLRVIADDSAPIVDVRMKRYDGTIVLTQETIAAPVNGVVEYDLCSNETEGAYGEVLVELRDPANTKFRAEILRGNAEGTIRFGGAVRNFGN